MSARRTVKSTEDDKINITTNENHAIEGEVCIIASSLHEESYCFINGGVWRGTFVLCVWTRGAGEHVVKGRSHVGHESWANVQLGIYNGNIFAVSLALCCVKRFVIAFRDYHCNCIRYKCRYTVTTKLTIKIRFN